MGPAHWDLGEIDELLVPPGKAPSSLVNRLCLSLPGKSGKVKPFIHTSRIGLVEWLYL